MAQPGSTLRDRLRALVARAVAAGWGPPPLGFRLALVCAIGLIALAVVAISAASVRTLAADGVLAGLLTQAETLASALEAGGGPDAPAVWATALEVGPNPPQDSTTALLEAAQPPPVEPDPDTLPAFQTAIDVDQVERLVTRALSGTGTRAMLFGIDGALLADSATALSVATDVISAPLEPVGEPARGNDGVRLWDRVFGLMFGPRVDPLPDVSQSVSTAPDGALALGGIGNAAFYRDSRGNIRAAVATPVAAPDGTVIGALRVVSPPHAISAPARERERAMTQVFAVGIVVAIAVSLLGAAVLNRPIRALARAARGVQAGSSPDVLLQYAHEGEVGMLAEALHDMTAALTTRIDAIENFAGEVAHELKNPLTSLRSAVETLPRANEETARARLLDVIAQDVRRIDRLISEISDASKLDAELSRKRHHPVDLGALLRAAVDAQNEIGAMREQRVTLSFRSPRAAVDLRVMGNDARLGQVFVNLIDNARSFTPASGTIAVIVERLPSLVEVRVEDEGPGIDEAVLERIFDRFYTDRPDSAEFGSNSGLGLAISKQIVEAHGGEIFAENRYATVLSPERTVLGARFTVRLPTP